MKIRNIIIITLILSISFIVMLNCSSAKVGMEMSSIKLGNFTKNPDSRDNDIDFVYVRGSGTSTWYLVFDDRIRDGKYKTIKKITPGLLDIKLQHKTKVFSEKDMKCILIKSFQLGAGEERRLDVTKQWKPCEEID